MASAEPMLLGSPTSPVASSGAHGYLHAYLMGEPAVATPPPSMRLWSGSPAPPSPQKSFNCSGHIPATQLAFGAPAPCSGPQLQQHQRVSDPRSRELLSSRGGSKEKTGAPPVQGLIESISSPGLSSDSVFDTSSRADQFGNSFMGTPSAYNTPGDLHYSVLEKSCHNKTLLTNMTKTPCSPAQIDPFYTQGEDIHPDDVLDDTWVTVFGFPPPATSFILQQFVQYGSIVKHVVAAEGNWMHIHYESKMQAKKALSKNGKVFGRGIMVGVLPCIDKKVMASGCGSAVESDRVNQTSFLGTPNKAVHKLSGHCDTPASPAIRPLTAAYRAATAEHEVVTRRGNTPHKNSGVISQAMEYMFGW